MTVQLAKYSWRREGINMPLRASEGHSELQYFPTKIFRFQQKTIQGSSLNLPRTENCWWFDVNTRPE